MKKSKMGLVWSGVLGVCVLGGFASVANAQNCACGGASQGVVYQIAISAESEAEALLQETDDPATAINLTVIVQDKAIVAINGEETYTMGTVRPYIVRGVKPGMEYTFVIDALLKNEAGAHFTAKKEVKIKAGSQDQVVLKLDRSNRPKPTFPPGVFLPPPPAPAN